MAITERWLIIRADANQFWDVSQNKLISNPNVVITRAPAAPGAISPLPPMAPVTIHVTPEELSKWVPGQGVDVSFSPAAPEPRKAPTVD